MYGMLEKIVAAGSGGPLGNCNKHGQYERKQYGGKWLGSCQECVKEIRITRKMYELEERRAAAHKAVGDAGIPVVLQSASIADWDVGRGLSDECRVTAIDFAGRSGEFIAVTAKTSLLLLGTPGVGKSWAAAAIAKSAIMAGEVVVWRTARGLSLDSRAGWSDRSQTQERDYLSAISGVDLLVIDDVGDSYMSERDYAVTRDILTRRYDSQLRTIITSNHGIGGCKPTMQGFGDLSDEAMLGARVYSRLRQTAKLVGGGYIAQKDNRYSF